MTDSKDIDLAHEAAGLVLGTIDDENVADACAELDTQSSASRQHYIDTGCYLRRGEAETA